MPDETQISESVHEQLRSKRSAIAKLSDAKQDAIYSLTFERFVAPRLTKGGLKKEEVAQAKRSYINGLKGAPQKPLDFEPKREGSFSESAKGAVAGVGGGIAGAVAGGLRSTSELLTDSRDLTGLGEALVKPMERFSERGREASEFGSGPMYAKGAEFIGKMIPGIVGAEAALPALETLTGSTGLGTLVQGAASTGSPGARVAQAAASGTGFDLGSGDNTSGRRAVQYAAFDFLSRPVGRLVAKVGGKYATSVLDYVGSVMDSRRAVGKTEAVTVGTEAAQKAESKLVTKLAELFPDKAERVKKGESLENVYSPEDVAKALSESKPKKTPKVATPKVEVKPEQATPEQEEKKLETEAKSIVTSHPATQETVSVVEQLSGVSPAVATAKEVPVAKQATKEAFEYKIDWDRYKDKGAEGVALARSNATHEVTIQAKEAADTIKTSPTLSAEEKQKALQSLGDKAKHTLYKIKTEKVPEGFVSAKTRDAARKATEFATATAAKSKETTESLQRNIATGAEDPAIKLIEDSKELESQYKDKGRTTLYNAITKAWTKQGHGDIQKLNEMLKVGLEKVEAIKPQQAPKVLGNQVNEATKMLTGNAWNPTQLHDWPENIVPPHLERLGSKLGISKYFLGAKMDTAAGINLSHDWYQLSKRVLYAQGLLSEIGAEQAAQNNLWDAIHEVKNLPDAQKREVFKAIKENKGDFVFLGNDVKGKSVAIHETMHSLISKELGHSIVGKVDMSLLHQLVVDTKDSDERDVAPMVGHQLSWISRKAEYYTELMTQYFLGNVTKGSKTDKLAEAILRNSKDPEIQKLVGTSLGVVVALGLDKQMKKKKAKE